MEKTPYLDIEFDVENKSFWFQHRNTCIVELVKKYPPSGVICDVGGGNGSVSVALEKQGFKTLMVEPSISGITNAKKRGLTSLVQATFEETNFQEPFSAIGLFDVLEHIENDGAFLKKVRNQLSLDGKLYISVPTLNFLWSQDDYYAYHYRRYTMKTLRSLLENSGFSVEYLTYFFSLLIVPIGLFRALPYRLGFQKHISTEKMKKEHVLLQAAWMRNLFGFERRYIQKGRVFPFGTSCLGVATAK